MRAIRQEWSSTKKDWVNRDTLTAREARSILDRAKSAGLTGMAAVNKNLTKQQSWQILNNGIAKIADDDPIPSIVAKNIQREFGRPAP